MSRILLLLVFLIWLFWATSSSQQTVTPVVEPWIGSAIFLGALGLLVLTMGIWSRLLARSVAGDNFHHSLRRFNKMMATARMVIPAWFAGGVFALGWGTLINRILAPVEHLDLQLPGLCVGTLPALLAWMGLWWSQYPADRALREQSMLIQLDEDMPLHVPPGFWGYVAANLRLQLLFAIVPVLLIMLVRDISATILRARGIQLGQHEELETVVNLVSAAVIFLFAPQILRRVLHTEPLPDSPLRRRLEGMCRAHGLKYREILLWRTQNNMGNAALLGLVPRLRYILLSDLLLETMTDEQIEAVFAHEMGHIVHRHMLWYVIFFTAFFLAGIGPGDQAIQAIGQALHRHGYLTSIHRESVSWLIDGLSMIFATGTFLLLFGYFSRRFERQADVFAARTMQQAPQAVGVTGSAQVALAAPPAASYVGSYGASVFGSALRRVAAVNNIPVSAPSWCHGSIQGRMDYLQQIGQDPIRTRSFDRSMTRLYTALLCVLCAGIGFILLGR